MRVCRFLFAFDEHNWLLIRGQPDRLPVRWFPDHTFSIKA
jgi:hypothetical protein